MATPRTLHLLAALLGTAVCLVAPPFCRAQMLVRVPPGTGLQTPDQSQSQLPYEADSAGGRDSLSAGSNAARQDPPAADVPDTNRAASRPDEDELIREYIAKAGPVGPRKLFSDSHFDATLGVGVTYDDNILTSNVGPRQSDVITTVSGGVRFSLGDFAEKTQTYVIVSYAGTGNFFADHGSQNSYDQDAVLDLQYRLHQLAFASKSTFQERHDATTDFGERVTRDVYGEDALLKYYYSPITTLSLGLHAEQDDNKSQSDTTDLSLTAAIDYAVTGKISLGYGVVGERLTATGRLKEWSEQAEFRLGYAVTKKIKASAELGIEYRTRDGNSGDSVTPVFAMSANWNPFNNTILTFEAHRHIDASGAISGEDYLETGFGLGLRQNLLKRFYLRLDAGYINADYKNVTAAQSTARTDNFYSIRGTVGYDFVQWFQILAFYEHREDESTGAIYSFTSNRVGLALNLSY